MPSIPLPRARRRKRWIRPRNRLRVTAPALDPTTIWHYYRFYLSLAKATRDPVAPAQRSEAALRKVHSRILDDGSQVHSFGTLLKLLSGIVRNICRVPGAGPDASTFEVVTTPDATQQRAYDLLETIQV